MKKELQRNVNGMTSGGGSIQHPLSIHSASIGSRWKVHGLSLMMIILLLFTMGIGQVWATIGSSASSTFTCGTTTPGFNYVYTFDQVSSNTDTIVFSGALLYGSSATYAYTNSTSSRTSSDSSFPATLYNEASGGSATNGKGIYSSGTGSNCNRLNMNNTTKDLCIKVTNCVAVKISANSNDADNPMVLKAYLPTDLTTAVKTGNTASNNAISTAVITGLTASNTYIIEIKNGSSQTGRLYEVALIFPPASSCSTPTDPSITATPTSAEYTEGGTITLEASATGTSASTKYTWYKGDTWDAASAADPVQAESTSGATYTKVNCVVGDAGTYWCKISNGSSCDVTASKAVSVSPSAATCPSGLTISGTAAYTEGQTISLNAALSEGNGEITYTWYKGADLATAKTAGSIGTGTSFSKASCTTGDAGNYFCVATKATCSDAESAAYPVTVEEKTCPTSGVVYTMTMKSKSLSSVTQNTEVALVAGDYATENGGVSYLGNKNSDASKAQIKTEAGGIVYFNGNDAYLKVALECPLQPGDLITIEGNASSTELKYLITNTNSRSSYVTSTNTTGTKKYYTVVADDILDDESVVYIWREASGGNKNVHSVTITRPYAITFSSAKGSAPSATTGFQVTLEEITGVDGWTHTGWTANQTVKVGGEDKTAGTALAVDATAVVSSDVTFTATWEVVIPTFAVTYKANNGTEEADVVHAEESEFAANTFTAPEGKMFSGWNTQADGNGTPYAVGDAVTAVTTVFAQWVVDPTIRLILKSGETYSINTEKFVVYAGTELQNEAYTVGGKEFGKNFKFGGNVSSTPFASQTWSNKFMAYDVTTNSTDIKVYLYNKNSGNKKFYYQIVPEGEAAAAFQTMTVTAGANDQVLNIPTVTAAKGARVLFGVESADVRICQVEVLENGTALPAFGTVGYEFSIPGRAATTSKAGSFDGFEFKTNAELKFISGQDYIALRNIDGSQYVKFTVASDIQLQVTTPNSNKFYVCTTAVGDSENDTQYGGSAATHNVNLHTGTYYIVPTAGSSDGEVRITKLAFATAPAACTVTFKDGSTTLGTQSVWSGDKATALSPAPTKSGYRFVKWQLSGADYDFNTAVTADIELDAVWQKTWKVTFNSDGGSDVAAATVDDGVAVAAPDPAPTKAGYDFVEWQLSGSAYDFSVAVTADIELVATWEVAQDDASLNALSYNGNAIDVNSAVDVSGVQTYTVHLQWGSTVNAALISVTKNASSATLSSIVYNDANKQATFSVESGNHTVTIYYAIQFVIDAKRGTSIVKATTNNVVTGLIGGTIDQSYSGNANSRKLNKGNYFGVTLANDETFQEGDVFIVNITTPADLGKFMVFADKDRNELIADQGIVYTKPDVASPVVCPTGEMMLVLPAAANGKKSLYLSRENVDNSEQWNVTFSYIEVTREMSPVIKSFKFGDDAATIDEEHKTISIEVPYATDVTALTPTVEAYGNNGATYTPSGATDFTSPVNYIVTDAYSEFSTTYAVTVTKAAASTNADLASLAVAGYSLDFDPATTSYSVVLDYGTTVLPTITYEVEETGLAEAVKVEGGVNGATTITVTPEAGALYNKVYTINFSVSTNQKFVIYDGSTMTNIASRTGSDVSTGFSYSMASSIAIEGEDIPSSWGGKDYAKVIKGFKPTDNTNNIVSFVIPENYVAKVRLVGTTNSTGTERQMFIAMSASKNVADAIDNYIITSSTYDAQGFVTNYLLPNTYYLGSTDAMRLYEFSITLYPIDYSRNVTEGRYGTICLPNGGVLLGADLYEVAYYGETSKKIFFDEILSGVMEAGVPYVFLPQEGVNKLAVVYTDDADAAETSRNGLVGFIGTDEDDETSVPEGMYILQNNQYREVQVGADARIKSYRAYINLTAITPTAPALSPGRRRVSMSVVRETPTGFENGELINGENGVQKVLINGELFILRGEKMYDATGRLVK